MRVSYKLSRFPHGLCSSVMRVWLLSAIIALSCTLSLRFLYTKKPCPSLLGSSTGWQAARSLVKVHASCLSLFSLFWSLRLRVSLQICFRKEPAILLESLHLTIMPLRVTRIVDQNQVGHFSYLVMDLISSILEILSSAYVLIRAGQPGTYGAAAGDISPDISGGTCPGSVNPSNCNGKSPIIAAAPECPRGNCGTCYKVTNNGGIGSTIGGVGNSIIVQIIDSCPSVSPINYCKTNMPLNQRCGDANTNQLDIDQSAYMPLTGQAFGSVSAQPSRYMEIELTIFCRAPA